MIEKSLTPANFLHEYKKQFPLSNDDYSQRLSKELFKKQVVLMSKHGYCISSILPKLTYIYAKVVQVLYNDDTNVTDLVSERIK
jgi:hypothetical protein